MQKPSYDTLVEQGNNFDMYSNFYFQVSNTSIHFSTVYEKA